MQVKMILNSVTFVIFFVILVTISFSKEGIAAFAPDQFVTVEDTHFEVNGVPFFYAGANTYYLMVYAADPSCRGYVDEVLQEAAAMGLTVIRTWAFNDGDGWNALQTAPGVYDENVFQGLDYVIAKAHSLNLRVIFPLINNWDDYGGMNQYVAWSPTVFTHDDFYTDANTRQYYKDNIDVILNRENTAYQGLGFPPQWHNIKYKDDPTILAWELANEPRVESDPGGGILNTWIAEMSSYIKTVDSDGSQHTHLVTTGVEGWYSGWSGTDFISNHEIESIDFATVHIWPDHWGWGEDQSMAWVEDHIADAHDINQLFKPVILEEFGKLRDGGGGTTTRDTYYQEWYNIIYNMSAAGTNFWILYHDDYPDYDGFGVYYPDDTSTISIIETEAGRMNTHKYRLRFGIEPRTGDDIFPQQTAEEDYYTGAASALMNLVFLDPQYNQDQDYLYTQYHQGCTGEELTPAELATALTSEAPSPYNFAPQADTDQDIAVRKFVHWMDYNVSGVAQQNAPALIPIDSSNISDAHWVIVRGIVTDIDPCDQDHFWTIPDLELIGLWLNDPRDPGLGFNYYQTAGDFINSYLPVDGYYLSVVEPPKGIDVRRLDHQFAAKIRYKEEKASRQGFTNLDFTQKRDFDWTSILPQALLTDQYFMSLLQDVTPKADLTVKAVKHNGVNPLYRLVLFGPKEDAKAAWVAPEQGYVPPNKKRAMRYIREKDEQICVGIILDADTGTFRKAAWVAPEQGYVPMSKKRAMRYIREKDEQICVGIILDADTGTFRKAAWVAPEQGYVPMSKKKAVRIAIKYLREHTVWPRPIRQKPIWSRPILRINDVSRVWDATFGTSPFQPSYKVEFTNGQSVIVDPDGRALFLKASLESRYSINGSITGLLIDSPLLTCGV